MKQAGIKFARKKVNNLRYADVNIPVAKSEEELKILLRMVKEESEKANLKLNIKKIKCGSSDRFCFLSPKSLWMVTAAKKLKDACCLEGKL